MNPRKFVVSNQIIETTRVVIPIKKHLLKFCLLCSLVLMVLVAVEGIPQSNVAYANMPPSIPTIVGPGPLDPDPIGPGPHIPPELRGATITVNNTGDLGDTNVGDGFCDVDPLVFSEQCTLRAAIEEVNSMQDRLTPHRIEFEFAGAGPFVINVGGSRLSTINEPVIIDGTTQVGTSCPTRNRTADLQVVIDGGGTSDHGLSFDSNSHGSTIRGIVIGGFSGNSIRLFSSDNRVICSHVGVDESGMVAMGSTGVGIEMGSNATGNMIGGDDEHSSRNVISGHGETGILILGEGNQVQNNFIGTTADGMSALGNRGGGIDIQRDGNEIGGTTRLSRNLISSNGDDSDSDSFGGIKVASAHNNIVASNLIGLASDRSSSLPNVGNGVEIIGVSNDNIIGPINGGNTIAFNTNHGVLIENRSTPSLGNTIRGNAIYSNDSLGIELVSRNPTSNEGPDPIDPGDGDVGPNNHQNYPRLRSANPTNGLDVRLRSVANKDFIIELFENQTCDASTGHGEGETLIEAVLIQTPNNGTLDFNIPLNAPIGSFITATATDENGNTSEFSACIEVTAAASSASADSDIQSNSSNDSIESTEDVRARSTPSTAALPPSQSADNSELVLFLPLISAD